MSFGVKGGGGDGVPVVMPPRVGVTEDGGSFAIANVLNFKGYGVTVADGAQSGVKDVTITGGFPVAWTQQSWRIDPVNGNDANVGDDAHPLKTATEMHLRTGVVWEFDRNITVTIAGDLPATDCLNLVGVR